MGLGSSCKGTHEAQSFQTCNSLPHMSIDMSISSQLQSEVQSRTETQWRKSGSRSPSEALAIPQRL